MATVPFDTIDYLDEARDRVTSQLTDKQVFDKYLELIIQEQLEIQGVFKDLLQKRSIDEAGGKQLDLIGEIVGQPRELISADLFTFFGFQGALKADTFGDFGNPQAGSKFYDFGTPLGGNVLLDDPTYRLFIKAKILKNTTASTPEEIISFVNFLFGTTQTAIFEGQAEYTIMFGRELSSFEQVLLNYVTNSQGYPSRLVPKTVGVRINFGFFESNNYFGFQGVPGARGFGEYNAPMGYGAFYGFSYGGTDGTNTDGFYDGTAEYDGTYLHNGELLYLIADPSPLGGVFASLF